MSTIRLNNISTTYCLKNISFEIESGEFIVLLGSSGAGKSTLLNVISGLIDYSGDVFYNDFNMNKTPTERRNIGYLMQDIYLFPHMKVFENIAFGLRARSYPKDKINIKVKKILNLLQIYNIKDRYPKDLSGGERQRVGLARTLITKPKILLLDEPLSSLDPKTSKEIRKELVKLHEHMKLTTIFVTHNFSEAKSVADRIIIISDGTLIQYDSTKNIFAKPNKEAGLFIKTSN